MPYRARSSRRVIRKGKRNFVVTIIIIIVILYATLNWVLPFVVGGLASVGGFFRKPVKAEIPVSENSLLAPPVFNLPYEATNTAQIDISGYGTASSKVQFYLDDNLEQTVDVSDDGSFTIQNVNLSLGTNNIYGKSVDSNDKTSLSSKTIQLIYDNSKPALNVTSPSDGQTVQGDKKLTISGKTDPTAQIYVNDNRVIVNDDGSFQTQQDLNEGDNTFTIKAQDKASNTTLVVRKVTFHP